MARMKRRAKGGKISGKEEIEEKVRHEADSDSGDEFRRGGKTKRATGGSILARKHGGEVKGEHERESMHKRARGGNIARSRGQFARGGSPMSSAEHVSAPGRGGAGHEGADSPKEVG